MCIFNKDIFFVMQTPEFQPGEFRKWCIDHKLRRRKLPKWMLHIAEYLIIFPATPFLFLSFFYTAIYIKNCILGYIVIFHDIIILKVYFIFIFECSVLRLKNMGNEEIKKCLGCVDLISYGELLIKTFHFQVMW